jgi:hypothetical protein
VFSLYVLPPSTCTPQCAHPLSPSTPSQCVPSPSICFLSTCSHLNAFFPSTPSCFNLFPTSSTQRLTYVCSFCICFFHITSACPTARAHPQHAASTCTCMEDILHSLNAYAHAECLNTYMHVECLNTYVHTECHAHRMPQCVRARRTPRSMHTCRTSECLEAYNSKQPQATRANFYNI